MYGFSDYFYNVTYKEYRISIILAEITRRRGFVMIRSQKAGCAMLAGVIALELFLGTACSNGNKNKASQTSTENTNTESVTSGTTTAETTPEPTPVPVDPVEQEAKETAEKLGFSEENLHGRYDLFIKYADRVMNNPKLGEWRAYVLHYFPVVADHLPKEQEDAFLDKVSDLRMISVPIEDATGDFNAPGNTIRLYNDGTVGESDAVYTTVLHELTHFMDAFADGQESGELFYAGGRFAYEEDLTAQDWEEISNASKYPTYYASFITEGGAELYMSKYFGVSPRSYYCESCFLTGYESIFGSAALDELFFSKDSTMRFITLLKDMGYTDEKICKVIDSFNYSTYSNRNQRPDDMIAYEDVLVDMYEYKKGPNWKEDKLFCRILKMLNNADYFGPELQHGELRNIFEPNDMLWNWSNGVLHQIDEYSDQMYADMLVVMIKDDTPYLATRLTVNDGPEDMRPTAIKVEYDFDTEKVQGHEFITYPYPKTIPSPLPLGKELDDRLSAFAHDNSAMHNQTPYSGDAEMKELYDRAAEIGNKYGIKIYVGKDMPEYLERGDVADAKALNTALDKVENILSKFPEGFFDQLNYGYYSRFEIVLCNWPITDELNVYYTEDGYVFHIGLECRSPKELESLEERLIEAIFTAVDKKLINYFENFDSPVFSEAEWKTLNPVEFSYIGYAEGDYEKNMYEQFKDHFVSRKAMINAPRDRSQLMTALLSSKKLTKPCQDKAEFYCKCIREAFDDSKWPEKTSWEEELAKQIEKTEKKAA